MRFCACIAAHAGDHTASERFERMGDLCKSSFVGTFLNQYGYLFDFVDDNAPDWSVRPNMIFAVALDYSPLSMPQQKSVLDMCTRELLTPKGLRSLSPKSTGYNPMYVGPQISAIWLIIRELLGLGWVDSIWKLVCVFINALV